MQTLKVVVVVMGVLIVLGTVGLVVAIVERLSGQASGRAFEATLAEPPGTRIAGVSEGGGRVAVWLQGGGPDRLVVVDERDGRTVGRVGLGAGLSP